MPTLKHWKAAALWACTAIGIVGAADADTTIEDIYAHFQERSAVPVTPKTMLWMGGMTDHLFSRCRGKLNLSGQDQFRLSDFMSTAATRAALGGRYSDPNLGNGLGSQVAGMSVYSAGSQSVSNVQCGQTATSILEHIAFSINQQRGATSTFVSTCSSVHGERSCRCLAEIGQGIYSGFNDQYYSRDVIYGIIQSNPLMGFMIAGKCGIVNY